MRYDVGYSVLSGRKVAVQEFRMATVSGTLPVIGFVEIFPRRCCNTNIVEGWPHLRCYQQSCWRKRWIRRCRFLSQWRRWPLEVKEQSCKGFQLQQRHVTFCSLVARKRCRWWMGPTCKTSTTTRRDVRPEWYQRSFYDGTNHVLDNDAMINYPCQRNRLLGAPSGVGSSNSVRVD